MKNNKVTRKDILFLSISFFVIVFLWIGFNIYHNIVSSTISEDLQVQIAQIDGAFDTDTIQKLHSREKVTPLFEAVPKSSSQSAQISPTPSINAAPSIPSSLPPITPPGAEQIGTQSAITPTP